MAPIVELDPTAHKFAYLEQAGTYGPGLGGEGGGFEAECEILEYQYPSETIPAYAKSQSPDEFAFLKVRIRSEDFGANVLRHHEPIGANTGSKLGGWLTSLGVNVEGETFRHDTSEVPGLKCAVKVGDPRQDGRPEYKDRWYSGRILELYAAS